MGPFYVIEIILTAEEWIPYVGPFLWMLQCIDNATSAINKV